MSRTNRKPTSAIRSRMNCPLGSRGVRPCLEALEGRLALGDALFGPAVSTAWLEHPLAAPAPELPAASTTTSASGQGRTPGGPLLSDRWLPGATARAVPHGQTDAPDPQPRRVVTVAGLTPSDAFPRPAPGIDLPSGGVVLAGGPPADAAAGRTLAQVVNLVPTGWAAGTGERDLLLQAAGRQTDEAAGTELGAVDPVGGGVMSAGVRALFDLGHPTTGPFPSNVFTVPDRTHNTGRRVNLPFPDCAVYVSDCEDLAVLNELDGFNLQPRLSIPFDGPIDVNSVNSSTVFLVSLGSTVPGQGYMPRGTAVGIDQVVWDTFTNTLHVESDELLAQHTRFALIVTNGVRDADGDPVGASPEFRRFRQTVPQPYKRELLDAVHAARRLGVRERDIVTASVFTTQSATAVLEKVRDQIHAGTPAPADFLLGPKGERAVFASDDVTDITFQQHTGVSPDTFTPFTVPIELLREIDPNAVRTLAFGKYTSPDYEISPNRFIPAVGTRTGTPAVQGTNDVYFNLFLPSGPKPPEGWPVVVFGHGGGNNKNNLPFGYAANLAAHGIALIGINAVGHGFGPRGTLTVAQTDGNSVTFSAGGRGFDQNGNRMIGAQEGMSAARPRLIIANRDGFRQTVVDLMQLVRVIEVGMDVDGDGTRDLNPSRISYLGHSQAGIYGTTFLAVEPSARTGVLTSAGPGAPGIRLSMNRQNDGMLLQQRTPSLLNPPGIDRIDALSIAQPWFNENMPLRGGRPLPVRLQDGTPHVIQSPVINAVAGAIAIQEVFENTEWVFQSGSFVAYAPHLRKDPLPGVPAKSVIYQFAKGDQTAPNPAMTAVLRTGDLADRATYYRHDLAFAEDGRIGRNPHNYVNRIADPLELAQDIARGAQGQIGVFFASDGQEVIHPEPARFFEVPIQGPLPEGLNFIA